MLFRSPSRRRESRPDERQGERSPQNYGVHLPLKPGTEVLVGFLHGDPDRPVIAGAVPNPQKPSPVTSRNAGYHCIKTASGISINIVDEW